MKILQIISSIGNGGAEKFVVELSNELSKDHEVVVCSFKPIEEWMIFPKLLNNSIEVKILNKSRGFDIKIFTSIYKIISEIKPSVIHFHLDATIKYVLPFVLFFPKIKFIHTIHSDLNLEKKRIFKTLSKIKPIVKKIRLICISKSILIEFKSHFPSFNYNLIENGITQIKKGNQYLEAQKEIITFKKDNDTKVFISIGRIDENKNQLLQVEAFEQLKSENCTLIIIGDDPTSDKVIFNSLVSRNEGNIHFIGSKANIADYLEFTDAFLITSINEGLPIVAIEALSMGKPIITTKAGGMVDIVEHNKNGLLCNNNSKEELIKQIKVFLSFNNDLVEQISFNNLNKFNSLYNIQRCSKEYLQIYKS